MSVILKGCGGREWEDRSKQFEILVNAWEGGKDLQFLKDGQIVRELTDLTENELESNPGSSQIPSLDSSLLSNVPAERDSNQPCLDSNPSLNDAQRDSNQPCLDSNLLSNVPAQRDSDQPSLDSNLSPNVPAQPDSNQPCLDLNPLLN